jgi:hypothetical protein
VTEEVEMAKKYKQVKPPAVKGKIQRPILAKHAQEKYGIGRKWLLARIASGEIRAVKAGHNLVLEERDVAKLAMSSEEQKLVERALARHGK